MVKVGAIALFGLLAFAPMAQASGTPAFVNATMCDAAAPIASNATIFSRKIRAERRAGQRSGARAQAGTQASARQRAPVARPAPVEPAVEEAPSLEAEAVLRPAVHFCVTPRGEGRPVRYT
ncbi:hypothetical protein J8J14_00115 [Roseomonas sp. SSH11]|uniref:Uncharacterized protein n=1 Tax=Pararoseomonas baculiformis TaxID=2820812 RepID=A0ABS4A840_9PROT|nr:hypothetical protein [Pararoseomonas baculiformis]MBP0443167.1 hypothetical protein [Pararoseomonas baculiformis]